MNVYVIPIAKFRLGKIVATPNALETLTQHDILRAIQQHQAGEWGELGAEDKATNQSALLHGGRLFSCYQSVGKVRFYVITEADRSATTVLLPEDY
jgi:hypothetical protein